MKFKRTQADILVCGDYVFEEHYWKGRECLYKPGASGNAALHVQDWFQQVWLAVPESLRLSVEQDPSKLWAPNLNVIGYQSRKNLKAPIRIWDEGYLVDSSNPLDYLRPREPASVEFVHRPVLGKSPYVLCEWHFPNSLGKEFLRGSSGKGRTLFLDTRHPESVNWDSLIPSWDEVWVKVDQKALDRYEEASGESCSLARDLSGKANLIQTLGRDGCSARLIDGTQIWRDVKHQIYPVHSVGCGDSFFSAFIALYLQGEEIHKCLELANEAGALSASKPGVHVVTREGLKEFLKPYKEASL